MKAVNDMTKKEILREVKNKKVELPLIFKALIIIPTENIHDSDFRCMKFVAVSDEGYPLILLESNFDVIHINGIGGLGHNYKEKPIELQNTIFALGWQIDCLKKSKLLQLFLMHGNLIVGNAVSSSFEIYSEEEKPESTIFKKKVAVLKIVEIGERLISEKSKRVKSGEKLKKVYLVGDRNDTTF